MEFRNLRLDRILSEQKQNMISSFESEMRIIYNILSKFIYFYTELFRFTVLAFFNVEGVRSTVLKKWDNKQLVVTLAEPESHHQAKELNNKHFQVYVHTDRAFESQKFQFQANC